MYLELCSAYVSTFSVFYYLLQKIVITMCIWHSIQRLHTIRLHVAFYFVKGFHWFQINGKKNGNEKPPHYKFPYSLIDNTPDCILLAA